MCHAHLQMATLNLLVAGYDTSAWSMLSLLGFYLQAPQHIKQKVEHAPCFRLSKAP